MFRRLLQKQLSSAQFGSVENSITYRNNFNYFISENSIRKIRLGLGERAGCEHRAG